jgi:hypothetical protein
MQSHIDKNWGIEVNVSCRFMPHSPYEETPVPSPYKQHRSFSTKICLISWFAPRHDTHLEQATETNNCEWMLTKMNWQTQTKQTPWPLVRERTIPTDRPPNELATWTKIKTHKQQNYFIQSKPEASLGLWNKAVGYGFHSRCRNPIKIQIWTFVYYFGGTFYVPNTVIQIDL